MAKNESCVFLSLSRSSASSAKRFLLLFRSLASVATFRWRGKVAKGDLSTFGEEVSETFLGYCLGCNFALSREDCQRFLCSFGKEISAAGARRLPEVFMYFSLRVERKVRKERHLRGKPTVFPSSLPFPLRARRATQGRADCAEGCRSYPCPQARHNRTALAVGSLFLPWVISSYPRQNDTASYPPSHRSATGRAKLPMVKNGNFFQHPFF